MRRIHYYLLFVTACAAGILGVRYCEISTGDDGGIEVRPESNAERLQDAGRSGRGSVSRNQMDTKPEASTDLDAIKSEFQKQFAAIHASPRGLEAVIDWELNAYRQAVQESGDFWYLKRCIKAFNAANSAFRLPEPSYFSGLLYTTELDLGNLIKSQQRKIIGSEKELRKVPLPDRKELIERAMELPPSAIVAYLCGGFPELPASAIRRITELRDRALLNYARLCDEQVLLRHSLIVTAREMSINYRDETHVFSHLSPKYRQIRDQKRQLWLRLIADIQGVLSSEGVAIDSPLF